MSMEVTVHIHKECIKINAALVFAECSGYIYNIDMKHHFERKVNASQVNFNQKLNMVF